MLGERDIEYSKSLDVNWFRQSFAEVLQMAKDWQNAIGSGTDIIWSRGWLKIACCIL